MERSSFVCFGGVLKKLEVAGKLNSWRNCVEVDHMTVVFGDVASMLGDAGFNRIKVCHKGMGERGVIDKLRG